MIDIKKLVMHISIIPDYRQPWKITHKLSDILLLTICAVISGVEGWADIENSVQLVLKVPHRHEKGSYKVDSESESYLRSFSGAGLNFMRVILFMMSSIKNILK